MTKTKFDIHSIYLALSFQNICKFSKTWNVTWILRLRFYLMIVYHLILELGHTPERFDFPPQSSIIIETLGILKHILEKTIAKLKEGL